MGRRNKKNPRITTFAWYGMMSYGQDEDDNVWVRFGLGK